VTLDPEVGAVLLAVALGYGVTRLSRRRRLCETCGRPIKSILCACRELEQMASRTIEGRRSAQAKPR
jgi:hypothetical protein